jgi:hypothetical protein
VRTNQLFCSRRGEAHARLIAVRELDAACLKGALNHVKRCAARLANGGFELMHSNDSHAGMFRKVLLAPSEQPTRRSTLSRRKH